MKLKILLALILISVTFSLGAAVEAHPNRYAIFGASDNDDTEDEEINENMKELQEKIKEYEDKIKDLQAQEKSLQQQIDYANSQISLTELRISQSEAAIVNKQEQIIKLGSDIENLSGRIDKLEGSINYQEEVLGERIRARYKSREDTPLVVILGATTMSRLIQKAEYLKVLEKQDHRMLTEMNQTKDAYGVQKNIFVNKKEKEELLKEQLEIEKTNLLGYKSDLDKQRADKEELLARTENDENKYQALLAQVQSELAAMQMAINLPSGNGEKVEKGDIIGLMGNTGCSSGPHLHFGYVKGGKTRDPLPYLENDDLEWPVDNWQITQYFGANYSFYMNNFGIPGHDALDIVSKSQWSGAPVKAAKDGVLYYAQDAKVYCPWLNNSIGKGAIIDHGDGERTIYWHLQ